jgi:hypothetical protein
MNFEDWVIAGRPRSWSPLHDQLLSGGLIAYKKDVSNPNANCTRDFLREFYRQLLDARRKKEEQRFEQAKTVALQKAKEATGAARTEELDFIT